MRFHSRLILIFCARALLPLAAQAGNCDCTTQTLSPVGGQAYDVFSTNPWQPDLNMAISCNGNASYNVSFTAGNSGNTAARRLDQAGGDSLPYNIYTDANRNTVWAGSNVVVFNASGSLTIPMTLYLKITAGWDVRYSGNAYRDTINVTMTPTGGTGGPTRSCTFTIALDVEAKCQAPAATLAFGTYDPVSANATVASPKDGSTNLVYKCTKGISATIGLDNGSNVLVSQRRLAGPSSNFLLYDLFTDSLRTNRWSTGLGQTVTAASGSKSTPLGGAGGIPVYGRITGGQDVGTGDYNDSVLATINY